MVSQSTATPMAKKENVRSKRNLTLPLKWHGGKSYLASEIIKLIPKHTHYVEPFFGGGSVLFSKPISLIENHSEVVNDLNSELTNFWCVLRDKKLFKGFYRRVEATPFSKVFWEEAVHCDSSDSIDRAVAFFVRYRQSRQGLGTDFATMSRSRTRRGMNEQASSWFSAIDGLKNFHDRLKRVVILSDDAIDVIVREDSPHTFFYLDPPYLHETRFAKSCYEFEMSTIQHTELLGVLSKVKGKFLISGYPSDLYRNWARKYKLKTVEIEIDNKASNKKTKPKKTECLWFNY